MHTRVQHHEDGKRDLAGCEEQRQADSPAVESSTTSQVATGKKSMHGSR